MEDKNLESIGNKNDENEKNQSHAINNSLETESHKSTNNSNTENENEYSYSDLFGTIKGVVTLLYIGGSLATLMTIFYGYTAIKNISLLNSLADAYDGAHIGLGTMLVMWMPAAACVFSIYVCFTLGDKIIKKDVNFLSFFNSIGILTLIVEAIIIFIGHRSYQVAISQSIGSILSTLIYFFLWNLYFTKSLDLRNYMGTNEYLKRSSFTEDVKDPLTKNYESANNIKFNSEKNNESEHKPDYYCMKCGNGLRNSDNYCDMCGEHLSKYKKAEPED